MRASEIRGRAENYRLIFSQIWDSVGEALLKAETAADAVKVIDTDGRYTQEFTPIAGLIPRITHDPKFPKRRAAQMNFLADSLAGRGWVSPRTSRNICERERKRKLHQIIRQEYYVECTCGYKGPALHGRCKRCGPEDVSIPFLDFFS